MDVAVTFLFYIKDHRAILCRMPVEYREILQSNNDLIPSLKK